MAVAILAIAVGALAQSATGMGFSLVAAPALIVAVGPHRGVSTVLMLAVLASLLPMARDWRHSSPRHALRLLVPTLAFTPVVAFLLRGADTRWLALAAGVGVLGGVALLASGLRSRWLLGPGGAAATGLGSAFLNVLGGVGGPPIGLYAANAEWEPRNSRATLHTFFLVQNIVTVALIGVVLPGWPEVAALVVGAILGMLVSSWLPVRVARAGVLGVSIFGGLALMLSAA